MLKVLQGSKLRSNWALVASKELYFTQRLKYSSTTSSTAQTEYVSPSKKRLETSRLIQELNNSIVKVPSPKHLKKYLDKYIIGQDTGKRVMSVAVYNHYLRINDKAKKLAKKLREEQIKEDDELYSFSDSPPSESTNRSSIEQITFDLNAKDEDLELSKSNILLLGPSGSGKTLLAKTLAKVLNVPFSITDCTQLTQAGYIGEDVELCIERLLINSNYDVEKAEKGIVVLDEVDKLSKPSVANGTKDVAGEGVQQALLKLIEGTTVHVQVKKPINKEKDGQNNNAVSKKNETYQIDTSNILFVLMGAFVGLDQHISTRLAKTSIGFEADINEESGSKQKSQLKQIKLEDGRKVSALELLQPQDLVSYGMIPELIGRVPVITGLESLNETDLLSILTEPKNALLSQYEYIFKQFGVRLAITQQALTKIADLALSEGTGARGLRGIMERLLLDINYECPDSGIQFVLVNEHTVETINTGKIEAKYFGRGDILEFIDQVMLEDVKLGEKLQLEFRIPNNEKNTYSNSNDETAASG